MQDAHSRLDVVDVQFQALAEAVEKATTGQGDLVRTVADLTGAVNTLRGAAAVTQESLKTFITDSDTGREKIAVMLGDVIDKKTGGWVRWVGISLLISAQSWGPKVLEILRSGIHG